LSVHEDTTTVQEMPGSVPVLVMCLVAGSAALNVGDEVLVTSRLAWMPGTVTRARVVDTKSHAGSLFVPCMVRVVEVDARGLETEVSATGSWMDTTVMMDGVVVRPPLAAKLRNGWIACADVIGPFRRGVDRHPWQLPKQLNRPLGVLELLSVPLSLLCAMVAHVGRHDGVRTVARRGSAVGSLLAVTAAFAAWAPFPRFTHLAVFCVVMAVFAVWVMFGRLLSWL